MDEILKTRDREADTTLGNQGLLISLELGVVSLDAEIVTLLPIVSGCAAIAGELVGCIRRHSHRLQRVFRKLETLLARVIRNASEKVIAVACS